jgi:putative membrane protein
MRHFFMRWLITTIAVLFVAQLLPGIEVTSALGLILAALILGILNAFLKPLMVILTLPITVFTFGLFLFVINGILLYLTAMIVHGFDIANIWVAIIASILISIISTLISWLAGGTAKRA